MQPSQARIDNGAKRLAKQAFVMQAFVKQAAHVPLGRTLRLGQNLAASPCLGKTKASFVL